MEKPDINIELLVSQWIDRNLSLEEEEKMRNHPDFAYFEALLKNISQFESPEMDLDTSFNRLIEKKAEIENEPSSIPVNKPKIFKLRRNIILGAIAASILLFIIGPIFFWNNELIYETGLAEKIDISLPDGSQVALSAMSSLKLNKKDWNKDRTVSLQGEAFFEVEEGSSFVVETNAGNVSVLGTKFNVKESSYGLDVQCFEGKVSVKVDQVEKVLNLGQAVQFQHTGVREYSISSPGPDWQQDFSQFEATRLDFVFEEMKRYYKNRFILQNLEDRHFTGRITHTDLDAALTNICGPMGLQYTISPNGDVVIKSR